MSSKQPPGQQRTFTVTNPDTKETRTVTQEEWRTGKLGQQGFVKPADQPEEELPETETPEGEEG